MRNTIIGLVIVAIVGVGGYFVFSKQIKPQITQFMRVIDIVERILPLMEANTDAVDSLFKYLDDREPFYNQLRDIIRVQGKQMEGIQKQLDGLPTYEIPDASTVHPEDYEECLIELERSRLRADTLVMVVHTQRDEISLLRALNASQGIVIHTQAELILERDTDIKNLRAAYNDVLQDANRKKWIGYSVGLAGIVIGLLL